MPPHETADFGSNTAVATVQDGASSPLLKPITTEDRGSRARTPVQVEDGRTSPMQFEEDGPPSPIKDDALLKQIDALRAQLAAKSNECAELERRLSATPVVVDDGESLVLTEALQSVGSVLPDVARQAVLEAHRKRVDDAQSSLREALATKAVLSQGRSSRALLQALPDEEEHHDGDALEEACERDALILQKIEHHLTGGDDDHVHLLLDDHYASKLRNDADALR